MQCKIFSKIPNQTTLREVQPNTAPFFSDVGLRKFFSDVGLRKFVFASELFLPRPYFISHLVAKRGTKISWLLLQFLFRRWWKSELKMKNWNYKRLLSNSAKEGVGKRFFNLSNFYIGTKFYVKLNSSLARSPQMQVGNWAQM